MPKDAFGRELKVGDTVLLPMTIKEIVTDAASPGGYLIGECLYGRGKRCHMVAESVVRSQLGNPAELWPNFQTDPPVTNG